MQTTGGWKWEWESSHIHVHPPPPLHALFHHLLHILGVADIALHVYRSLLGCLALQQLQRGAFGLVRGFRARGWGDVRAGDGAAFADVGEGDGAAEAGGCACDYGGAVVEAA